MDLEKLDKEIAKVQDLMAVVDAGTEDYKFLIQRLSDLEDLRRKLNNEDPEMIKALAEQNKVDAQVAALDLQEDEGEKNRKHSKMMMLWKALGIVGLTFLGHILDESSIPRKADQKMREIFWKEKD